MINQYFSDFQIVGSTIRNFKIKNDFITLDLDKPLKKKLDISHSITSTSLVNDEKALLGTVHLNIRVTLSENKKRYTVDILVEGCFTAPAEIGEENFKSMLKINGVTSLYSIARGFIQSTTAQTLVVGNVLLPMLNVAAYSKDMDEENS